MDHEDIQRLTWKDIHNGVVWTYRSKLVRGGSKDWFQIPINAEIKAILKEIEREQGLRPAVTPIFERKTIYNAFRAAVRCAGLYSPDEDQNVRFKSLRHTFGSHLAMRGRHPKEIADLMGHKRIDQTMTYMHLSPDQKQEAVHSLDGLTGMSQNVTKKRQEACQY
jgi:integrase